MAVLDTLKLGGQHRTGPSIVWPLCPRMSTTCLGCSMSRGRKRGSSLTLHSLPSLFLGRARPFTCSLLLFSSVCFSLAASALLAGNHSSSAIPTLCLSSSCLACLLHPGLLLLLPLLVATTAGRPSKVVAACTQARALARPPPGPPRLAARSRNWPWLGQGSAPAS
jgi:hypothetical protein